MKLYKQYDHYYHLIDYVKAEYDNFIT